ncbi:MAG: hypothetical protein IJZ75_02915, partial [Clostridia bacterium]|nr:hypothetical protein [Clostridia bacterium]
ENTAPFIEALANATKLRDKLGSQLTCNTTIYPASSDAEGDIADLGENVLSKVEPTIYYYDGTEKTKCEIKSVSDLYDGDFNTQLALSDYAFTGDSSYIELIYNFGGALNVEDFLVGFSDNKELAKANYKIFLADSMEDLFTAESIVASFYNENGDQAQKFDFDNKADISGSYLAFRFYGKENGHLVLSELGAYGDIILYDIYAGGFTNEQVAALGDNILAHKDTVAYVKSGNTGLVKADAYIGIVNDFSRITNGDVGTGIGVSGAGSFVSADGEEVSVFLVFDLGKAYNLEKILFSHATGANLQTGKYELYASMDKSLITRSESRFASYDNMKSGPNGCTQTQVFTAQGAGVAGRYIGYRVTVPVSDYAVINQIGEGLAYPRFYELGVYGTEYVKPMKEINFLNHVPVDIYRTDAGGNKTTVNEDEYSGDDYKLAYDGDLFTTIDTPIAQNGKYIDYIFNLCVTKNINSVRLTTATENIKRLKVYAAETLEEIWNDSSCVLDYEGEATNQVSRTFAETPIRARYVRFRILETESGAFDPTEFEVIGWNTQEFAYTNLMMENAGNVSVITENKDDFNLNFCSEDQNEYIPAWMSKSQYGMEYGFDGDENTVTDLYGGNLGDENGNGKETISLLFDLGNLMAIDNIEFVAGSSKEYWPSELKFYFGENDMELFGKDAKPVKTFEEKSDTENGSYSYNFLPELAQYVRVEIVESSHEYFSKHNYLVSIIAEIQVNGLEVVGFSNSEGVAASVTDPETGIRVDVLALRENDVFTKLQDILVAKRAITEEEKKALAAKGAVYASHMYSVFLLDANGDIINDTEGRNVRLCLPESLFNGTGDIYVVANVWGEYLMVDYVTIDDYYCVEFEDPFGISAAFCEFSNTDVGEDTGDDVINTDNDVYDESDEEITEDEVDEEDEDEYTTLIKKIRRPKNSGSDFEYLWLIIVIVAVVVVAAAGTIFFLILKKKKKEKEEAEG